MKLFTKLKRRFTMATSKVYDPKQHTLFSPSPTPTYYTVEENIPIPSVFRQGKQVTPEAAAKRTALASMRIGNSVAFQGHERSAFASARANVQRSGKKKFTTRLMGVEFGEKVYRIWRTK
jgi:hypothetical protein